MPRAHDWLIRGATLGFDGTRRDVRIRSGRIVAIGERLRRASGEQLVAADGCALLPGLHDHHVHLLSLASAQQSLACGPPNVRTAAELAALLSTANGADTDWLRGTGYHECVAGDIDRRWLDGRIPDRPVRIQHRSGRLWILNGAALERIRPPDRNAPMEHRRAWITGRLLDADPWLRSRLAARRPSLAAVSERLAMRGVTGLTDATAQNDPSSFEYFVRTQRAGDLRQRLLVMGDASLDATIDVAHVARGATKIHLHEHALPRFDELCALIERSHASGRPVAAHCVTLVELALFTSALATAGSLAGDRIEHASLVPDEWLEIRRESRVTIVTQPNFVAERGDRYRSEIAAHEHAWLYRARSFLDAGIALAAGTDAPFGAADPWHAMQAAVDRLCADRQVLGAAETLTPDQACSLFLGTAKDPGRGRPELTVGGPADLCLLDRDWPSARRSLGKVRVRLTLRAGAAIWDDREPRRNHREDHREPHALQRPCSLRERRA